MPRIDLVLSYQPSAVEVFIAYKRRDGIFIPSLGIVDTGAELSLFPIAWLKSAEHTIIREVNIGQAGVAKQAFDAVEAEIIIQLEDLRGNISEKMRVGHGLLKRIKLSLVFRIF